MTLVLSCLMRDYVIQVSDQRITRVSDGALVDNLRNKGTMFCSQMAFSYTGLAEIDGIPTDLWLAEVLAGERTLEEGIRSLVTRATEAFLAIHLPSQKKRHAFVGVGFLCPSKGSPLRACQVTVSNFLSAEGRWLTEPRDSFLLETTLRSEDRDFMLCRPVGVRVPEELVRSLEKNIRACLSHETRPLAIIRLVADTIRNVANSAPTVGKSLLVIFVPRRAVQSQPILFTSPLTRGGLDHWDTSKFLHIPANSVDPWWCLPNFVCNGILMSGVFEQESAFNHEAPPEPDVQLSAESYSRFLLTSTEVERWAEFVRSIGVAIETVGTLPRDIKMLYRAGITTPKQIEQLLKQSEPWGRELLAEYHCTYHAEEIREGKLSLTRSGIVISLLVANYLNLFSAEVLAKDYDWGLAEPFLSIAARHKPPLEVI